MKRSASLFTTLATALALMACGGNGSTDPGDGGGGGDGGGNGGGGDGGGNGDVSQPAAVSVVSGTGQTAKTLENLATPLVVRVTDADGIGVSGVSVSWSVASGPGSVTASSTTNAQGQASATYTGGTSLGQSTIEASVTGVTEVAEFDVETTILVVRMLNTAFVVPGGGDEATVPLGTTVEWVNRDDGLQHTARSTDEPPGGTSFDSGLMGYTEQFSFTPDAEGSWTYLCDVHPTLMTGATITVSAASGSGG